MISGECLKSLTLPLRYPPRSFVYFIYTAAKPIVGILISTLILVFWLGSLIFLLPIDLTERSGWWLPASILGRTFIHTGLFIVAHDAMHGNLFPSNRQINDWMGSISIRLYALLPYRKSCLSHWSHHQSPGQASDPDFHDGTHTHLLSWYVKFMGGYLNIQQNLVLVVGMSLIFHTLRLVFHIPTANLLLFWVLPIVLSSLQLFVFGTYLPHRGDAESHQDSHHATSNNYPTALSFLTCYHFGYHWEHHQYPDLPWYKLPAARNLNQPD